MIEIHIRISKKLVFSVIAGIVGLFVLWLALTALGHSSGGVKLGPTQTEPSR